MPATRPYRPALLRVWDLPLRLFHWLLAASVALAFLSAFEASPIAPWHQTAGWCAAVLIAFRIVWGFVGGEAARFSALRFEAVGAHLAQLAEGRVEPTLGHNPLGAFSIVGLLSLTALTVASGALVQRGWREGPHEILAFSLLALVGVHVAAVVVMSVLTGESLLSAMWTGRKSAARHPGATDAKEPGPAALLIGAAAIAASAYAATLVDPIAFAPHSATERGEAVDTAARAGASPEALRGRISVERP